MGWDISTKSHLCSKQSFSKKSKLFIVVHYLKTHFFAPRKTDADLFSWVYVVRISSTSCSEAREQNCWKLLRSTTPLFITTFSDDINSSVSPLYRFINSTNNPAFIQVWKTETNSRFMRKIFLDFRTFAKICFLSEIDNELSGRLMSRGSCKFAEALLRNLQTSSICSRVSKFLDASWFTSTCDMEKKIFSGFIKSRSS